MKKFISKIYNMIRLAYVTGIRADDKQFSFTQVESNGRAFDAINVSPYGLFSIAPLNSLFLLFSLQGYEESSAGIPFLYQTRFKDLKEGEVLLGNSLTQTFIKLDKDGNIEINSKKDVNITVTGNTKLTTQQFDVVSPKTNLGEGGQPIARVGDQIQVIIGGITYMGQITTGGTNTSI